MLRIINQFTKLIVFVFINRKSKSLKYNLKLFYDVLTILFKYIKEMVRSLTKLGHLYPT